MRRTALTVLALGACVAVAGCGGGGHRVSASRTDTVTTSLSPTAQLEQGVREAIAQDHRLSVESLWTNTVPAHPTGTAGPALAAMRESVAQRAHGGVRVKTLSQSLRILSIELAPSYTTATATILDVEKVLPSYSNGRPRGRAIAAHERARLQLHRIGDTDRFVVWQVTTL